MVYRALSILAGALLAATSMGCASIAGEQSADAKFLIAPKGDATFFGWSEITVEQDASSVNQATLRAVTIEVLDPPEVEDLGFIQNLAGEAVISTGRTKLVEKKAMPEGERVVPLDLIHEGDLRSFFEDKHTIRIEWTGNTNPAFTAWPADGIWISVHIVVLIE